MKRLGFGATVAGMTILLCACSSPGVTTSEPREKPATPVNTTFSAQQTMLLDELQSWLPGFYSNYTQVIEAGGTEGNVTNLTIRELPTPEEAVFLFETHQRGSAESHYDLYFANLNPVSGKPELHFARMTGSDLSMPLPETLDIGRQRAMPGCVISLTAIDKQPPSMASELNGKSPIETCQFEDPINGKIAFERSISISNHQINMSEVQLKPGESLSDVAEQASATVTFQKHQAFEGTVSLNMTILSPDSGSKDWQKSTTFNLYDDGQVSNLYDTNMQPMDYAIKLSRMPWRENEPPYLRLEVIHTQTGTAQAYSWFEPDSEQIDWEMDWVEVHLKELDF